MFLGPLHILWFVLFMTVCHKQVQIQQGIFYTDLPNYIENCCPPPTPHTQIFIQPFSHQIYFLLKNASLCVNWKLYLKDVEDNWVFFERCDFKIIGHWKLGRKLDDFPITYMLSGSPQDVSRAKAEIDDMITKV